jgi:GNAT superfamily N-acetyltransferase
VTVSVSDLAPAREADALRLMREVYGRAMTPAEFEWFFDRSPLRGRIVSVADEDGRVAGFAGMVLARAVVDSGELIASFAVHAVTHPSSRRKGIFGRLELRNEELAAAAGASIALGFTNPMAGPILVGRLGWRDLYRMRIWARPLRPLRAMRRLGGGGLPPPRGPRLERFTEAEERAWRSVQPRWGNCLVRDEATLNWRYLEAPREYRAFASEHGYAVVGHAELKGVSVGVVCDLVGPPGEVRRLLRRCVREARGGADGVIGVPAPGQIRAYVSSGFVPTRETIRVIGKPLRPDAALPREWYFSLGDTDFL